MNKTLTKDWNLGYVMGMMFVPGAIGYVYPGVGDWICLIGAFCCTTMGVTFPMLLTVKEMEKNPDSKKWQIRL